MNHKKVSGWVIIVLLIILIPITIFSTIMHFTNNKKMDSNNNLKYNIENKWKLL